MRITAVFVTLCLAAIPVSAIDFLGMELCQGSTDIGVELPPGSALVLENVEIGDHGGLVLLLSARHGKALNHVNDLMTGIVGTRGTGDGDSLQWSNDRITALAQSVASKYVALAVTGKDDCRTTAATAATAGPGTEIVGFAPSTSESVSGPSSAAAAAAVVAAIPSMSATESGAPTGAPADFEVIGALTHEAADPTWVDVMGVVANHTETGYRLATFDLSFYDGSDALICVDTISVSVLKTGQERAFRDAIRCPGYDPARVARTELQFAGGY